jgi:hypothetical protein
LSGVSKFGATYAQLAGWFVIERETVYYIKFAIIPCIVVVLVSYLSFWVPYAQIPGRVSLAVIPLLTLTVLLKKAYRDLPVISYDTWLLRYSYVNV